ATTAVYTRTLHDALPILLEMTAEMEKLRKSHAGEVDEYLRQIGELQARLRQQEQEHRDELDRLCGEHADHLTIVRGELQDIKRQDRKSTRLNSSHVKISY